MTAPALTVYQQGVTVISADNLNSVVQCCDSFAQMRAISGVQGMCIYARGQTTPGDGFQGMYWWNYSSVSPTDNNYTVIVPSGSVQGNWQLLPGIPQFTKASLPSVTSSDQGLTAYCTNGRNTGEGAGSGSGCLVSVNSSGVWAAVWSGVLVTS